MMRRLSRTLPLLVTTMSLWTVGVAYAHGKNHDEEAKVSLTGEVVDLVCYMQHPASGQGPDHAACAQQCINKGLPSGLKVGDQLYLLMGEGHASIVEKVAPLAGKRATVAGTVIDHGGMKALVIHEIKPAGG